MGPLHLSRKFNTSSGVSGSIFRKWVSIRSHSYARLLVQLGSRGHTFDRKISSGCFGADKVHENHRIQYKLENSFFYLVLSY